MENKRIRPLADISIKPAYAWALCLVAGFFSVTMFYCNDYGANIGYMILWLIGSLTDAAIWTYIAYSLKKRDDGAMGIVLFALIIVTHFIEVIASIVGLVSLDICAILYVIYLILILPCAIVLFKKYNGEIRNFAKLQIICYIAFVVVMIIVAIANIHGTDNLLFAIFFMFILTQWVYFPYVLTEGYGKRVSEELQNINFGKIGDSQEKINGWLFFILWFCVALFSVFSVLNLFGLSHSFAYSSEYEKVAALVFYVFAAFTILAFYKRREYAVYCFYYCGVSFLITSTFYTVYNFNNTTEITSSNLAIPIVINILLTLPFILYPLFSKKLARIFPKTNRKHSIVAIILIVLHIIFEIMAYIDEINYRNGDISWQPAIFDNAHRADYSVNSDYDSDIEENEYNYDDYSEETAKTVTVNGVDFNMVLLKGGTFDMGGTDEQGDDAGKDELPVHSVQISHDFYMGETEVTQELWEAVMNSNPSKNVGDNLPVEMVSWNDCLQFIEKLNELTELHFRLPTEEEWEYACRGGINSNGYKYSGNDEPDEICWSKENSDNQSHSVAQKEPNEVGLYDMSGNVYEWCQSRYNSYGDQATSSSNKKGNERVRRGGSWRYNNNCCRVSFRGNSPVTEKRDDLGLRLVLDVSE